METQEQRLAALKEEAAGLNPDNLDERFRLAQVQQQIAEVEQQLGEQQRLQQQADNIEETVLPYDYDERWGVAGANEEIRNLIQQVKEFLFQQHNEELAQLRQDHAHRLRELETDLAEKNDLVALLQAGRDVTEELVKRMEADRATAEERQADAERKRDNAVVQKEEAEAERDKAVGEVDSLKRQINELEGMLRTYRSRNSSGAIGGLVLTSTLKDETEEERKARKERERVEELNRMLARRGSEPLRLPPSPMAQESAAAVEDGRFHSYENVEYVGGLDAGNVDGEVEGQTVEEPGLTLEGLNERLLELEAWKNELEGIADRFGI